MTATVTASHSPSTQRRWITLATFAVAMLIAIAFRTQPVIGLLVLAALFVPLEKLFPLRPQKVFRPGLITDLTHMAVNRFLVSAGAVVLAIVMALPLIWIRSFHLVDNLSTAGAVALSIPVVFVANYWGHRLTHQVPFLWRFHAVHHSIEQMDWLASARLHPLDSAFTQAVTIVPMILLGYSSFALAGIATFITLLALFQHANVRLRFPVIRWIVPTPEWHHWHHAIDAEARDTNFGLPIVDKLFGTAYLPKDRQPTAFGTDAPVPQEGYLRHLAYPFSASA
jgi:sterol desaturase/sphingolipid hydroxylase (fatty acid hydroxylase superfamily)